METTNKRVHNYTIKTCNECGKEFPTKNYTRHVKSHENARKKKEERKIKVQEIKQEMQENLEKETLTFNQLLWRVCGQYDPKDLYHIILKEEAITPAALELFKQRWVIIEGIYCSCRGKSMEGKLHTHFLAKKATDFNIKALGRRIRIGAKEQQACKVIPVALKKTLELSKAESIRKLIDVLIYIQTEKGAHQKFDHSNKAILKDDNQAKEFRFSAFKDWAFSQLPYLEFLRDRVPKLKQIIIQPDVSPSKVERLRKKIWKYLERIELLEKKWTDEEEWTPEKLENDANDFINICKLYLEEINE